MSFLQTQEPLRFYPEWANLELLACLQQLLPQILAPLARKVHFPPGFTDEADTKHQQGHSSHLGLTAAHIGKAFPAQIADRQFPQDRASLRPGQVDCCQSRHVGEVDVPPGPDEPPFQPLLNKVEVARGGGDEVSVVCYARNSAVVEHDAGFIAKNRITHAARPQVRETITVNPIEEHSTVAALKVELAQRPHVNQPDAFADRS